MSVFRVFRIEAFNDENLFEKNFNELLGLAHQRRLGNAAWRQRRRSQCQVLIGCVTLQV